MRIAIADDFERDRNEILKRITQYLDAHQICAKSDTYSSGESFLNSYLPGQYDLVVLDLYMEGMSGMDVARRIRSSGDNCQIVFITSSDACAIESYEVKASNYLMKPVTEESINSMMRRCMEDIHDEREVITLVSNRTPVRVRLQNVLWINAHQNYLQFHTDAGEIRTYMTFAQLTELLGCDRQFLICYKGCMVNMDRVRQADEDCFQMDNGDEVQIRKRGKNQIRQTYLDYLCGQAEEQ